MKDSIFIHGILQRSGTNLLNQILLLHPDCLQPTLKVREDWFLHHSDSLYEYSQKLFRVWSNPRWGGEEFPRLKFYSSIGEAMLTYIRSGIPDISNKMLLSKTPSVQHLDRCFELFPTSKIIIIIRDPRDVAASAFKTWERPVKHSIRNWNIACKVIYEFERNTPSDHYLLLRFEDLLLEREKWIKKCLTFLNLEESLFPWYSINELPVFGSSEEKTWKVKRMSESFRPIGRWKTLPADQMKYLSKIDSKYLNYFGYPTLLTDSLQTMPIREERLQKLIELKVYNGLDKVSIRERSSDLRNGIHLITKAIFGK